MSHQYKQYFELSPFFSFFYFCSVILFKIVAQFVILGCTWILGLYQTNLFFQVLFIILNSQQGTFLFIVHCLLNKEVRCKCICLGPSGASVCL